eukprot:2163026-Amphidinium_carterae.1
MRSAEGAVTVNWSEHGVFKLVSDDAGSAWTRCVHTLTEAAVRLPNLPVSYKLVSNHHEGK